MAGLSRYASTITASLFGLFASGCATPTQIELDSQVKTLCANDGGLNVYETVTLPDDQFNQWGQISFFRPTQNENSLGPEYIFKWEHHTYLEKKNNDEFSASLSRVRIAVIRKRDSKLLSEMIIYQRGGGDIPGPWHPSGYSCPNIPGGEQTLLKRTFLKSSASLSQ